MAIADFRTGFAWVFVDRCAGAQGHVQTDRFFDAAFIEMLMVGCLFRRRGLGLALMSHFRERCTGTKLFSSTNMSNLPMQRLLIKAGFMPSGYIDNLDENDPEIVFFCPLS